MLACNNNDSDPHDLDFHISRIFLSSLFIIYLFYFFFEEEEEQTDEFLLYPI